jgi:uncharacterized protein (TIGR04255 family)
MLEHLTPISENHSISRVIATIITPQSFVRPNDIFDKIKEDSYFNKYQRKSLTRLREINIDNSKLDISKDTINGFIFEEYNQKGNINNIFRIANSKENKALISLENRIYTNWSSFRNNLLADLDKLINNIDFYIEAISLVYIDEFGWTGDYEIPTAEIFNNDSELLNTKFLKSKNSTSILISQTINSDILSEEKIEVSFSNVLNKIIINHQSVSKLNSINEFTKDLIEKYLNEGHESNKSILNELLTVECKKLIKLTE